MKFFAAIFTKMVAGKPVWHMEVIEAIDMVLAYEHAECLESIKGWKLHTVLTH